MNSNTRDALCDLCTAIHKTFDQSDPVIIEGEDAELIAQKAKALKIALRKDETIP
jgi:hypothetical protein